MKARLPWLLLAVSVALNVFFVGGALYSMAASERLSDDPKARVAFVAEQLALSEAEVEQLAALRQRIRERWGETRAQSQAIRGRIMMEVAKPELDLEQVNLLVEERAALRGPAMRETVSDMHGFLATLSPEQKAEFVALASERGFFRRLFGRARSAEQR